jgi:hypothetical protein
LVLRLSFSAVVVLRSTRIFSSAISTLVAIKSLKVFIIHGLNMITLIAMLRIWIRNLMDWSDSEGGIIFQDPDRPFRVNLYSF